jgi:heptosyltransferase II
VIGLNPGGDRANRRWPPEKFAAAARKLKERCGASFLIFGGPGEEPIAQKIRDGISGEALNLAGRLTLPELAAFLSRSDLLITNDSGPMHMAAALKTPVVALFGPEDPRHFQPYTFPGLYRVIQKPVDCRPCRQTACHSGQCLDVITTAEVVEASVELLNQTFSPAGRRQPEDSSIAGTGDGVRPEPSEHVRYLR